jgi:hypothetical protein
MSETSPETTGPPTVQNLRPYEDRAADPVSYNGPEAEGEDAAADEEDDEAEGLYAGWTNAEMKDELRSRTDPEGNPLKVSGDHKELLTRLTNADNGVYE